MKLRSVLLLLVAACGVAHAAYVSVSAYGPNQSVATQNAVSAFLSRYPSGHIYSVRCENQFVIYTCTASGSSN